MGGGHCVCNFKTFGEVDVDRWIWSWGRKRIDLRLVFFEKGNKCVYRLGGHLHLPSHRSSYAHGFDVIMKKVITFLSHSIHYSMPLYLSTPSSFLHLVNLTSPLPSDHNCSLSIHITMCQSVNKTQLKRRALFSFELVDRWTRHCLPLIVYGLVSHAMDIKIGQIVFHNKKERKQHVKSH